MRSSVVPPGAWWVGYWTWTPLVLYVGTFLLVDDIGEVNEMRWVALYCRDGGGTSMVRGVSRGDEGCVHFSILYVVPDSETTVEVIKMNTRDAAEKWKGV